MAYTDPRRAHLERCLLRFARQAGAPNEWMRRREETHAAQAFRGVFP